MMTPALQLIAERPARATPAGQLAAARLLLCQLNYCWRHRIIVQLLLRAAWPLPASHGDRPQKPRSWPGAQPPKIVPALLIRLPVNTGAPEAGAGAW